MRGSEFAELRAFAAVVEQRSFARAARTLGLSASALSQTIRQLETRLGVRLLDRTTRSVAPTAAGVRLNERLLPTLRELDAAVAEAATGRAAQPLRVAATRFAVRSLIAPRLGRFHRAHPDVVLDLAVRDAIGDFAADGLDAGIRAGAALGKETNAVRLTADLQMMAVASPAYLTQHGAPALPRDLARHACIVWRQPNGDGARWPFRRAGRAVEVAVEGALRSNDRNALIQAALQGIGILYTYGDPMLLHWLAQGRLQRVLADWSAPFPGLFLHHSSRRPPSPALAAFIACLLDRDVEKAE